MGVEGPRNDDKRLICLVKDFKISSMMNMKF